MKTSAGKKTDTAHASSSPQKGTDPSFFAEIQKQEPFFSNDGFFQPKLTMGAPDDPYEQQADAIADRIVSIPNDHPHDNLSTSLAKPLAAEIQPVVRRQRSEELSEENAELETVSGAKELLPPADPPLRRKEEEELQRKPAFESPSVLDEPAVRDAATSMLQGKSEKPPPPPAGFERRLQDSKGKGSPLPANTQRQMESGFGADFSSVQIHTGPDAAQMSQDIGAQAFTHGSDIYFNQGKYAPGNKEGDRLLAHELTHTIQQGAASASLQRQGATDQSQTQSEEFTDTEKGTINRAQKNISIPQLRIPNFKTTFTPANNLTIPKRTDEERPNTQAQTWDNHVTGQADYTSVLQNKLQQEQAPAHSAGNLPIYFLKLKAARSQYVIGNETAIKNRSARPMWNTAGESVLYDVDHKRELQLGGEDNLDNYWLLEREANQSSGREIRAERDRKIRELLTASAQGERAIWTSPPELDTVRREYNITFQSVTGGLDVGGRPNQTYELSQIISGQQFQGLENLSRQEVENAGLQGDPNKLVLFTNATGGGMREIAWGEPDGTTKTLDRSIRIGRNFEIQSITYTRGQGGTVSGRAFKRNRNTREIISERNITLDIANLPGVEYGGYISQASIDRALKEALTIQIASPISLSEINLEDAEGFVGRGIIRPSLPFLKNDVTIDIVIDGDGARLEKRFNMGELNVPAPFQINNSELFVSVGTNGVRAGGRVNFAIQRVGSGFIEGSIGSDGKLAVAGSFDFDTQLFDPARVEIRYENEQFSVSGTIGIPRNKVRGIRRASATINYSEGTLSASGEAELDIRGVERGTLNLTYTNEQFSIGGSFQLSDEIPGIRSGSVDVNLEKSEEEGWKVRASGTAQPDIPGIDSSLSVAYDDGALTISGRASYERNMLSGTVEIGATNRAIGEDGQPTGPATDNFRVYGGGELTLQLTPWLAATAGVRFLPNGEIEVRGRIGLPSTVDVFPRKSFERTLFSMPTIEIPIFAIPLGPRSIGLVATINGGLDFTAGFGPGQLQELFAEVTYNPSHPENTTVRGGGRFVIPADAGLRLRADLGLGVSVAIASLTGGIEIAGTLGLEGEAAAQVDVNWSPQGGLRLDALGSVTVNPKFRFDVNLLARASLDLFLFELSKEWRYNLLSFEWGPGIQFGIRFPIHYVEGEPFDISFDDIEVIYPDLDIGQMARGIASDIKDRVF